MLSRRKDLPLFIGIILGSFLVVLSAGMLFKTASASTPSLVDSGTKTCVTNASAYCTVTHSLGATPNAVVATVKAPVSGPKIASGIVADSFTATSFRVRVFQPNGTGYTSASVTFSYAATGTATAPPTSPPPPTTNPPATTTAPPTSTPPPAGDFPTADDTGGEVPTCTTPKNAVGDFESRGAGDVIENLDIAGELNITDPNVTVRCVRVHRANGNSFPWVVVQRANNLTLDRVTVAGEQGQLSVGGIRQAAGTGLTLDHVKIIDTQDGCSPCGSGLNMRDSYIRLAPTFCDPAGGTDPCEHNDGVQAAGGSLQIVHNTVINPNSQNSTIALLTESSSITDSLIQNNFLDIGREISAYGGCSTDGHPPVNVVWDSNTFAKHSPTWTDPFLSRCAGVTLTANHWDDGSLIANS